jgi:xanthine dehydrogenase accessory factor
MGDRLLQDLITALETSQPVALLTVIKATGQYAAVAGQRALIKGADDSVPTLAIGDLTGQIVADVRQCLSQRRPQLLNYRRPEGDLQLFVEVQGRPPTLLIVGAGHIALPLAQLGKLIDFEVVVLDDRPKYANKERFPMADQVIAQPFQAVLRQWPIDHDTYIVLVTRGHRHDVECLLEVLDSPAPYIGLIGSKRRVKAVFTLLEQEKGVDPAKLERVFAPIGLDIGAETPAEIGICIVAEIINFYRGGRAQSLSDTLRADRRLPLHPARRFK